MTTRQIATFVGVGAVSFAGVMGVNRWRRIEVRRAALNTEYAALADELRGFDEDRLKRSVDVTKHEEKMKEMRHTVDALWTDRLERYALTNADLHACITALPEGLGILKGLTNHYQYMMTEMRRFVGFDVACSKVHNLALLLEHYHEGANMASIAETIQSMFVAEPLVRHVCDNLLHTSVVAAPASMGEVSRTFWFCIDELDRSVEAVARRVVANEAQPSTPGVLSDGVNYAANAARAEKLSSSQRELEDKRASLVALLRRERFKLHTEDDVRTALNYAESLLTSENLGAALPTSPRGKTPSTSMESARFMEAVRGDAETQRALRQLHLWQDSASAFLLHQQGKEALECYQLLLSETLTKVNRLS